MSWVPWGLQGEGKEGGMVKGVRQNDREGEREREREREKQRLRHAEQDTDIMQNTMSDVDASHL